jgi:hypothetical protein
MTLDDAWVRGWRACVLAAASLLSKEGAACLKDIVAGDEVGKREANARCGALLTAEADVRAMHDKVRMPQRDLIDLTEPIDLAYRQGFEDCLAKRSERYARIKYGTTGSVSG